MLVEEYDIDVEVAKELTTNTYRPKVDLHEKYMYIVMHFPTTDARGKVHDQEIDFIIGKDVIITAHYEKIHSLQKIASTFETAFILTPFTPTIAPIASICGLVDIRAIFDLLPGILALASIIIFSSLSSGTSNVSKFSKNLGLVLDNSTIKPKFLSIFTDLTTALSVSPTLKYSPFILFFL